MEGERLHRKNAGRNHRTVLQAVPHLSGSHQKAPPSALSSTGPRGSDSESQVQKQCAQCVHAEVFTWLWVILFPVQEESTQWGGRLEIRTQFWGLGSEFPLQPPPSLTNPAAVPFSRNPAFACFFPAGIIFKQLFMHCVPQCGPDAAAPLSSHTN